MEQCQQGKIYNQKENKSPGGEKINTKASFSWCNNFKPGHRESPL